MATIGVVSFSATSPHKLNILQQAVNNNVTNKNNIINNNRDVIIVRKDTSPTQKQTVVPSNNTTSVLIPNNLINQKAVKKSKLKETGTGKVSNPTPIAVARRNARERNRVKQVNNGFATLRQHIPAAIAASFEQSGNSRGPNKKLSKVETLRMAVEYIRSLEDLLSSDDSDSTGNSSVSSGSSITSFPSPSPSSPMVSTNSVISQNYPFSVASTDDDEISLNPNCSPRSNVQQYIRIPGTDTFQLITTQLSYEDEENIQPGLSADDLSGVENDILIEPPLLETGIHFAESQDLSVFSQANASLSSDIYSEHSLSPNSVIEHSSEIQYITQFTTLPPIEVLHPRSVIHNKISSTLISPVSNSPRLLSPTSDGIGSVITIIPQSPLSEDHIGSPLLNTDVETIPINEDHMINAITWWNQDQRHHSPKVEES